MPMYQPSEPVFTAERKALVQSEIPPASTRLAGDGTLFIDFGRSAFGTLLIPPSRTPQPAGHVVHLGEKLAHDGRLDRNPPGSIRYIRIAQATGPSRGPTRVQIPPDKRNTGPAAIPMPASIGEVYPFRYAEIECAGGIDPSAVRRTFVHYPFDDDASAFDSPDPVLNAVWDLCKYTIKATTFCGVYVDGDRERIPYEGDATINQLSHYCVDREYSIGRYTHEYLLQYPTWPTEWQLHSVLMAWADYLYSGETTSLRTFYGDLCTKTLAGLAREDGLISTTTGLCTRAFEEKLHLHHPRYIFSHGLSDLVDWPPGSFTDGGQGERDHHEMMPFNSVVNAFHYRALVLMSRIAQAIGRHEDRARFERQADLVHASFNRVFFDGQQSVYLDGEGSKHASLHSNMFALAFGLVPGDRRRPVLDFVKSRGMACSVYGAQFLLEGLYRNGEDEYALELLTARGDRSWWNMIQAGSTMTMEAWDLKYKNNLDWNHAWGAAPANIIPRYMLGVRPLEAGFGKVLIQPQPGTLRWLSGTVPTPHGSIRISIDNVPEGPMEVKLEIPPGVTARVGLRGRPGIPVEIVINGKIVHANNEDPYHYVDNIPPGNHTVSRG